MRPAFTGSRTSISLRGKAIPGAEDRQRRIPGFDQEAFSKSQRALHRGGRDHFADRAHAGAQGHRADHAARRRFRRTQQSQPPALLYKGCREEQGGRAREQPAAGMHRGDRDPRLRIPAGRSDCRAAWISLAMSRSAASTTIRRASRRASISGRSISRSFTAVSRDADHGYVFVQERGPCIACLFPDMVNDDRYPCPGTPAIADIFQALARWPCTPSIRS